MSERRKQLQHFADLNASDAEMTAVDSLKTLVDYFGKWGSANERMQANYLLGRAYSDQHESPIAIHYFKEAIGYADTTRSDCNYKQMGRIYGQLALEYYKQYFIHDQIEALDKSRYYAWKGKDTSSATICLNHKIAAYRRLHNNDSAMYYAELSYKESLKYGFVKDAKLDRIFCVENYVEKGHPEEAKKILEEYEQVSGFFDSTGYIAHGREYYYYIKGNYYLKCNQLDSAEFWFRKELQDGKDFNNQNAGSKGLAELFMIKHQSDSAAKYALYSYAMNDSSLKSNVSAEVERAKSLYDYTRFQQKAYDEELRANRNRNLLIAIFFLTVLAIALLFRLFGNIRKREQLQRKKYLQNLQKLDKVQTEVIRLKNNTDGLSNVITEKENDIQQLLSTIQEYKSQNNSEKKSAEIELQKSDAYQHLQQLSFRGEKLSDEDLASARLLVMHLFPELHNLLSQNLHQLNFTMYNTCILLRLHFSASVISHFLGVSPGYISQIRAEMMKTLFDTTGSQKEFDNKIQSLH